MVDKQAAISELRLEKRGGGIEFPNFKTIGFQERAQRIAHGRIVIDDANAMRVPVGGIQGLLGTHVHAST
jgi:hypothetical protein